MKVRDALREGARILAENGRTGTETPSLDASLLLARALGKTRDGVLASMPDEVGEVEAGLFFRLVAARGEGRPVAYLTGRKEFWGRDFLVSDAVLVPRPDTELLVETALRLGTIVEGSRGALYARNGGAVSRRRVVRFHDSCTGSGCVALSVAADRPGWKVSASDISPAALEVARANARALLPVGRPGGPVGLSLMNLFDGLDADSYDLLAANPPYVGSAEARELSGLWGEPLLALDGGKDGLEPYRALLPGARSALARGGWLLLEAGAEQAAELRGLLGAAGFADVESLRDLAGLERVTVGRKP
jgi:release factor glutamine methyltransferase